MSQEATIRRGQRNARYAAIPNHVFEDSRLSMEARWLLSYLLSKPDNWTVVIGDIIKKGNCGRDKARNMIAELVKYGYAEREQQRDDGKFGSSVLVIFDEPSSAVPDENVRESGSVAFLPQTDLPATATPSPVSPSPVKSALSNNSDLANTDYQTEREARERDHSGSVMNADLIKRVQKFCTGDGYREGEWPKWAKSTIGHIAKQFAHLAAVEQDAACEWRDAFLAKCKRDRVGTPMPVANYFRDKVWTMLVDADKTAVRPVAGGAPAVSGGKVAVPVFGPAFAAARAWSLVSGPVNFDLPADLRRRVKATYEAHFRRSPQAAAAYLQKLDLVADEDGIAFPGDFEAQEWMRRTIDEGYPEANRLHEAAKDRNHVTVDPGFERLKDLCEAVPIGSAMWERWRSYHEERGWPFVPTPASMRVVFFPKGGPEGLDEFEEAARAAMNMERSDDHAA